MNGIIIVECLFPLQRLDVLDSGQRLSDQKQFDTIFRNSESLHPLCNFSFALKHLNSPATFSFPLFPPSSFPPATFPPHTLLEWKQFYISFTNGQTYY